nr:hypothetical protein [Tanacetum cinerariifolium]
MCGFKECSSYGALYNKSCGCSKGGFIDKVVRDKTPDSFQRPPHDCLKCGYPVDDFLNTSESSNDNTNVVNAPQEPFVFNQDPGENSSQSPPHIDHHYCYGCGDSLDDIFCHRCTCESCGNGAHYGYNCPPKITIYYDYGNDEESSIPLRNIIISGLPLCVAITPVLSTEEPKDSLIIEDKHLDTIPEKESDEFVKSSVENLVPNLSESEDLSNIGRECDVPICDDFTTFYNLLFDSDDNFSSSDDKSFFDEDVSKKIYSNPLFDEEIISIKIDSHHFNAKSDLIESLLDQDSLIISSSKIDSLFDEFVGELIFCKSIPPGIDEADCDPEEEIYLIEKFDSLMEDIDLSLTPYDSMPPAIENDDYDSKWDILILEELLSNDSRSLLENESFYFDVSSSPRAPARLPDDGIYFKPDSGSLTVKVVGDISEQYVLMPRLLPTQPTLASNEDKSPHLLSHRGFKAFHLSSKSPMMIYGGNIPILDVLFLHFYPPLTSSSIEDRVKLSDLK